jgi:hypothetical protein
MYILDTTYAGSCTLFINLVEQSFNLSSITSIVIQWLYDVLEVAASGGQVSDVVRYCFR